MKYYSTNKRSPQVDFKEATIKGLAPDKGLYFPEQVPQLDAAFIKQIENYSNAEIAYHVINPYVGDSIPVNELERIAKEAIDFDIPLVKVNGRISSLELFHGPTLAFKDVGARFMSRCLGYFVKDNNKKLIVLVATSGDTGGAVANGFFDVDGVDVVILYPSGKVSGVQEKQLTTLGKNIHALEVEGSFDDCQQMVKQAFADAELNKKLFLTSANSINVARWLPQQFYYFFAWKQWAAKNEAPVISVPSGNFGNICAGLLAKASGLPIKHFIAACNLNDTVPRFLNGAVYEPQKAVATISNAMDVGDPSNFVRILEIFQQEPGNLKRSISGYTISDEETKQIIDVIYQEKKYLTDPHGAVAYAALQKYQQVHQGQKGIFLETAHPVKFYDVVEPVINEKIEIPPSIKNILGIEKKSSVIAASFDALKEILSAL